MKSLKKPLFITGKALWMFLVPDHFKTQMSHLLKWPLQSGKNSKEQLSVYSSSTHARGLGTNYLAQMLILLFTWRFHMYLVWNLCSYFTLHHTYVHLHGKHQFMMMRLYYLSRSILCLKVFKAKPITFSSQSIRLYLPAWASTSHLTIYGSHSWEIQWSNWNKQAVLESIYYSLSLH